VTTVTDGVKATKEPVSNHSVPTACLWGAMRRFQFLRENWAIILLVVTVLTLDVIALSLLAK
jgi:hypothetical protein